MTPTTRMSPARLLQLIAECEHDLNLAVETRQKQWAETQKNRWAALDKLARRLGVVAPNGESK